jgi:hypothetical protein
VDLNLYVIEALAHDRLEQLRAGADLRSQLREGTGGRRPLRVALGLSLIRLGIRTLGAGYHPLARSS